MAHKLWGKKLSKSVSDYFKTKKRKVIFSTKSRPGGGLKALMDCPLKNTFVCCFPNKKFVAVIVLWHSDYRILT